VAGAAVGETLSTVTPETMAEFSSAFEQIMSDTAVDDLSGYAVETVGRSARAATQPVLLLQAT
jgi:ABC-type transporter MlaC component